ncbi:MAG: hypothetical protein K5891_07810, partial [Lachnospiraceae bacterium]|nr:hypothetical protein [Lachnospiraceae bacterium]
ILLIKRDLNDKKFIKDLDNVGIRINPLALYCYNDAKPYAHAFLLGYGALEPERLPEALGRMADMICRQL